MKIPKIVKSMDHLDDDIIAEAANSARVGKKNLWIKWGAVAASFAVVALSAALLVPMLMSQDGVNNGDQGQLPQHQTGQSNESTDVQAQIPQEIVPNKYKDVMHENSAIIWRWEYKTVYEKYPLLNFGGKEYGGRGREINSSLLGEKLGSAEARGEDIYEERIYTENFDVYAINGIDKDYLVAVKMEGKYYVFDAHSEKAPDTFGELMDRFSLPSILKLKKFSLGDKYYSLNDNADVWAILKNCRDAKVVRKDMNALFDKEGMISFTVISEHLAVYKNVFRVSADGYIWTNAFDYAYAYYIGEDNAKSIIDHAKVNSKEIPTEPYQYSVSGKIVDIKDGYFLLDDTEICIDAKDGRTYKIISTDIRVSRHFDFEGIKVGDIVIVYYDGVMKSGNLIEGAYGMAEGFLVDDDILIPE